MWLPTPAVACVRFRKATPSVCWLHPSFNPNPQGRLFRPKKVRRRAVPVVSDQWSAAVCSRLNKNTFIRKKCEPREVGRLLNGLMSSLERRTPSTCYWPLTTGHWPLLLLMSEVQPDDASRFPSFFVNIQNGGANSRLLCRVLCPLRKIGRAHV